MPSGSKLYAALGIGVSKTVTGAAKVEPAPSVEEVCEPAPKQRGRKKKSHDE